MRRFVGLNPLDDKWRNLFFGRDKDIEELTKLIFRQRLVLMHSDYSMGKTSLIKAALLPWLKENFDFYPIYISIPHFNPSLEISVSQIIRQSITPLIKSMTYLDKLVEDDNSIWFTFKKLQAIIPDKTFVLILDQFENFFDYPAYQQIEFRQMLADLIFDQIPLNIREEIDEKMKNNPDLLTNYGYQMLYSDIKLKILFASQSHRIDDFEFLKQKIAIIKDNVYQLEPFEPTTATEILKNIAGYDDERFESPGFDIDKNLLKEIEHFFASHTNGKINGFHIQLIGKELENIVIEEKLNKISLEDIPNISNLYLAFYFRAIDTIEDEDMRINARHLVEDELVFEHEKKSIAVLQVLAQQRYNLSEQALLRLEQHGIIKRFVDNKGDVFIELNHPALIDPILLARQQRIEYEISLEQEIKQKRILEQKAIEQEKRVKRTRTFVVVLSLVVVFLGVSAAVVYMQRLKAIKNQRLANSSLYAVLAFQKMDKDPTEALRLAQKAYTIFPQNAYASSALLSAFYRYGLFYQIPDTLDNSFDWAQVEPNTGKVITVALDENRTNSIVILYKHSLLYKQITIPTITNFAIFTPDSGFIAGGWDSTLYYFSPQADIKQKLHLPGIVWTASVDANNKRIAIGLSTGQIAILDSNFKVIKIWQAHNKEIRSLDFSNTGKLVSSADDNLIKLWSPQYKLLNSIPVYQTLRYQRFIIAPVHFSSDGQMIAAAINDYFNNYYVVRVWNIEGRELLNMKMADKWINDMIFLPQTNIILSASNDHSITYYDMRDGTTKKFLGHTAPVISIAYNPDKHLVYSVAKDKTIRYWMLRPFPGQYLNKITGYENFDFSSDGSLLIMQDFSKVDVFDLLGNKIAEYKSDCGKINKIKTLNNQVLIFASDNSITLWNPIQGKIKSITYPYKPVDAALVNGKIIPAYENKISIPNGIYKKVSEVKTDTIVAIDADEKKHLFIATVNGINVFDGKKLKGLFIKDGVKKFILRKNIWILTRNGKLLLIDKKLNPDYNIIAEQIQDFDVAMDQTKLIVLKNNKLLLLSSLGDPIFEYNTTGTIKRFLFNPNSRFFVALEQRNYQIFLKHWICSAQEVIKYIDNLHYFGNIPSFNQKYFSLLK